MTSPSPAPLPQTAATQPPFDLERFAGCHAYTVTERIGVMPSVKIGDMLIVDPGPHDDERAAFVAMRRNGRLEVGVWSRLSGSDVLGVVRGLVRTF